MRNLPPRRERAAARQRAACQRAVFRMVEEVRGLADLLGRSDGGQRDQRAGETDCVEVVLHDDVLMRRQAEAVTRNREKVVVAGPDRRAARRNARVDGGWASAPGDRVLGREALGARLLAGGHLTTRAGVTHIEGRLRATSSCP